MCLFLTLLDSNLWAFYIRANVLVKWLLSFCLQQCNDASSLLLQFFLFSESHPFRVLLTSDYLDIKGDQ